MVLGSLRIRARGFAPRLERGIRSLSVIERGARAAPVREELGASARDLDLDAPVERSAPVQGGAVEMRFEIR
jgi:hypothetical protein